jgi:hypothetical protein
MGGVINPSPPSEGTMNRVRDFMFIVVTVLIFSLSGIPAIIEEINLYREHSLKFTDSVSQVVGEELDRDLSVMSGDQILGMVPFALRGEYILMLDNIQISEGIDVENINFSGVAGNTYKITVNRVDSLEVEVIVANVIP